MGIGIGYMYSDLGDRIDVEMVENEHGDVLACSIIAEPHDGGTFYATIQLTRSQVTQLRKYLQAAERKF